MPNIANVPNGAARSRVSGLAFEARSPATGAPQGRFRGKGALEPHQSIPIAA